MLLETSLADVSKLLSLQKDRFTNPVGYTISQGMLRLYEGLSLEEKAEDLAAHIDDVIKVMSIQGLPPSRALAFIFLLKKAVRDELAGESIPAGLPAFESRIDDLTLIAFDIYLKYREKVYEIQANEVKADRERLRKLMERSVSTG